MINSDGGTTWDDSTPSGTEWEPANDPCPTGWRVPTTEEQQSLINADNSWTTQNGVTGRVFGSGSNTVFLPAAGYRYSGGGGSLYYAGTDGSYWSSTQYNIDYAYSLLFDSGFAGWSCDYRRLGFSVRCVQDNTTPSANYTVTVSANPTGGGTVSGGGTYAEGASCTVTATPNSGYTFVKWTENGTEVSTAATYQFSVTTNRTLVANFTPTSSGAETGVVINGVTWATRNVGAPGTFAATPESAGMFYQWNRKIGWSSTDPMVNSNGGTTWDDSTPSGTEWEPANDPCPSGWRVPTTEEQQSLLNSGSSWTTQSGVTGGVFGTAPNTIFLPAAGYRSSYDGSLDNDAGTIGYYWSSTQYDSGYAWYLYFVDGGYTVYNDGYRRRGFSVRCVQDNTTPSTNYTVTVSANPTGGGTVSGGGTYAEGASCTVTATPNSGYTFVNWTENSTEVSTAATYQFSVTANRTLVANFTQTAETGVEIGGIVWATRNVDAPGTFTATPEDAGMFYQWGSNIGWSSSDPLSATDGDNTWRNLSETGNEWQAANDPCPSGWRVPTSSEIQSLLGVGVGIWTTQNGVTGGVFGTAPNTIFLPAASYRASNGGALLGTGLNCFYWSDTPGTYNIYANCLNFSSNNADLRSGARGSGYSVRCVKKE
jgi:uncharacterized protein (TIGR02145 family)